MKLNRNTLRRIINEEAGKLGIDLNERVVGPTGRSADPVRFTWLPDLRRWEAVGKIVEDAKDVAIDFAVNPAFAAGDFRCMSTIDQGRPIFKWVDDAGNQIFAMDAEGVREKRLDGILKKVNEAFSAYMARLRTSDPEKYAVENQHRADHTTVNLSSARAQFSAPVSRKYVDPFSPEAVAPAPAATPSVLRRPGGIPGLDPMERLKQRITAYINASENLLQSAGMFVDVTPEYEALQAEYDEALRNLQLMLGPPGER